MNGGASFEAEAEAEYSEFVEVDPSGRYRRIVGVTTRLPAIQWLIEIKSVSKQLNFKICTLLLHSGKVTELVAWFRQHKNVYKKACWYIYRGSNFNPELSSIKVHM
ncbi:hypothetical protein PIB30_048627 [Stylosanthes scabra]|uniref:Trafficking protein particle complex subunit 11 domain-containing protein n=1 Tax=Stylosanthes scabra TaxID=79078 RepID=A0ABU6UFW0_9FABA|nr:hypothetical protein [Stylosanthes scabra]